MSRNPILMMRCPTCGAAIGRRCLELTAPVEAGRWSAKVAQPTRAEPHAARKTHAEEMSR